MRPSLLLLGLLSHPLMALEIPQADHLHKTSLSNGIKVYIEEFSSPNLWGSFKVVFKHPSLNHTLYAFDSQSTEWDSLEAFFSTCAESAQHGTDAPFSLHQDPPTDIAVIAVGNFSTPQMLDLIDTQFSQIPLNETLSVPPLYINYSNSLQPTQVTLNITLPNLYPPLHTTSQLKECWKSLFLQELLQQRFEECIRNLQETWVHPHPQTFYPITGVALTSDTSAENTLALLLWHLHVLQEQGFYTDCFTTKKQQLLYKLHYLTANSRAPDPTFLSSYYQDQFLLGDYSYQPTAFLSASLEAVQAIEPEDLLPLLTPFITNPERKIHITYPSASPPTPLTQARIDTLHTQIQPLLDTSLDTLEEEIPLIAPPTFILANNPSTHSFYQLPLTSREMDLIESIISTMANDNLIQLALNRRSIEKKGKKIEHVHPLRFMGYILSTKSLKNNARTIKKSSFKWDAFIDGFGKRMKEELARDNVYQHIPGFAALVGSTPEHVNHYIHKRDWEGLVKSLL